MNVATCPYPLTKITKPCGRPATEQAGDKLYCIEHAVEVFRNREWLRTYLETKS